MLVDHVFSLRMSWKKNLLKLLESSIHPGSLAVMKKLSDNLKGIIVLSLFDGISAGNRKQTNLKQLFITLGMDRIMLKRADCTALRKNVFLFIKISMYFSFSNGQPISISKRT